MDGTAVTPKLGIVIGGILVVAGVAAYVLSEFASVTALIPTVFGVVIALLGAVGPRTGRPELAVYGIGLVALLGILGSIQGVPDIVELVTGGEPDSTLAATTQSVLILFSLVLVVAAGRDVLEAR